MELQKAYGMQIFGFMLLFALLAFSSVSAKTHHRDFVIVEKSFTRLCHTKNILTVNGQYPGPTINARRGDRVVVRVFNKGNHNVTLHWHGVDQPRNPWSDGPEYITQCGIRPGASFTYHVQFTDEEGTVWWHAHSDWTRATVHGAIVVRPKVGTPFPYPKPYKEIPIILGEWWNADVNQVIDEALKSGADPNVSDAFTINGQPGDLYPCSKPDTFTTVVEYGKTYLLRVVNAAMNNNMFFAIAGHKLTVVGTDGGYTKPFTVDYIMVVGGQTIDVLVKADASAGARYYMAAKSFSSGLNVMFDNTTTTGVWEYRSKGVPVFPYLPDSADDKAAIEFTGKLRSLGSAATVPQKVDERLFVTASMNVLVCPDKCVGMNNTRFVASLNNVSFVNPVIDVAEAYFRQMSGVYGTDFPEAPPFPFNFTGNKLPVPLVFPKRATEVRMLEYGTVVEMVIQGTSLIAAENHPMHLHGYRFYVVGMGSGNFDEKKDPAKYNLVDPPRHNTVGVPKNGWAAIRFQTNNPGVWFMHCHLDRHLSWGMNTVFIVKNGKTREAQMLPPPPDMPSCF